MASLVADSAYLEHKLTSELYGSWNHGDDLSRTSSIDGNRAVIAVNSDSELGARIEMFEFDGAQWQHSQQIRFSDPATHSRIEGSLLLDGDRLFVVASNSIANNLVSEIVMFEPVDNLWQQTAVISAPEGIYEGYFGYLGYAYHGNEVYVSVLSAFGSIESAVLGYEWLNGSWTHSVTLQANNEQPDGLYAASIAYDGTHLVVGAIHMDNYDGAVFIYTEQSGSMTESQVISAPLTGDAARFGTSVSVVNDLLVISAPNDGQSGTSSGAIFTYQLQQSNWQLADTITASVANPSSQLGNRIWLEDNRIYSTGALNQLLYVFSADITAWNEQVIERPAGAYESRDEALTFSVDGDQLMLAKYDRVITTYDETVQVARSWQLNNNTWSVAGDMSLFKGAAFENMGQSSVIHQNTALVSSDPITGNQQVFVYQQQNDYSWLETQRLRPPGASFADTILFGSLALNDQWAAYTAYDLASETVLSKVFVYKRSNGTWVPTTLSLPKNPEVLVEYLGNSIALDGNRMAISGSLYDSQTGYQLGQILLYELIDDQWHYSTVIDQPFELSSDLFGLQLKLSGNLMVVSSRYPFDDRISGRADVYQFENNHWQHLTQLTSPEFSLEEGFAKNVDIAGDWVAVNAPWNDDMGNNAGAVFLYRINAEGVDLTRTIYAQSPNQFAEFGYDISLDNNRLLVGVPKEFQTQPPFDYGVGAAYLYQIEGDQINFISHYTSTQSNTLNELGYSVDLSGGYAIAGTPGDDQNGLDSGTAFVFVEDMIFTNGMEIGALNVNLP